MKIEDDAVARAVQSLAAVVLRELRSAMKVFAEEELSRFQSFADSQRAVLENFLAVQPNMCYWYDGKTLQALPRLKPFVLPPERPITVTYSATGEGAQEAEDEGLARWEEEGGACGRENSSSLERG